MAGWSLVASPFDEVLEALQALLNARNETPVPAEPGGGNFRCERCEGCSHCRFCSDCNACEDCTYCEGCEGCTSCTHCKHCVRCKQTTHSAWSSECNDSSYLTLCLDCDSCVQCFACVGLEHEEFCVLNEKLPRKAYFSRVAALRGALEERVSEGWRPPWGPTEQEDEAEAEPEAAAEPEPEPPPVESLELVEAKALVRAETLRATVDTGSTRPEPGPAERSVNPLLRGRTEITADIVEPESEPPSRPPRGTPPWSFADVRRGRIPPPPRDDGIPEPPPYGSGPHTIADAPPGPAEGSVEPRQSEEPTRRRDRAVPPDPPRDRYGWSAQAEGTPVRLGWSAQAEGTPIRLGWSVQAEGEPERLSWSASAEEPDRWPEPGATRWGSVEEGSGRWSRRQDEGDEERIPRRKAWDHPPDQRRDAHADDFDRRRRETARSPSATPLGPEDLPIVHGRAPDPTPRSSYAHSQRSRLGPDEPTEPDAPIVRRGSVRADLSGAALAPAVAPTRRPESRERSPLADEDAAAEDRGPSRSLGVARRPERPRPPEPRERTAVLLRGRAPARPTPPPAAARQPDAPSLRRAPRPSRSRDELATAEYLAVDDSGDDPERS